MSKGNEWQDPLSRAFSGIGVSESGLVLPHRWLKPSIFSVHPNEQPQVKLTEIDWLSEDRFVHLQR